MIMLLNRSSIPVQAVLSTLVHVRIRFSFGEQPVRRTSKYTWVSCQGQGRVEFGWRGWPFPLFWYSFLSGLWPFTSGASLMFLHRLYIKHLLQQICKKFQKNEKFLSSCREMNCGALCCMSIRKQSFAGESLAPSWCNYCTHLSNKNPPTPGH